MADDHDRGGINHGATYGGVLHRTALYPGGRGRHRVEGMNARRRIYSTAFHNEIYLKLMVSTHPPFIPLPKIGKGGFCQNRWT